MEHLVNVLRLRTELSEDSTNIRAINNTISDHEVFELAMQHDLPIFVSIDGSLYNSGKTDHQKPYLFDHGNYLSDGELAILVLMWQNP